MDRPTLRDVARSCRVSLATVSKALNPHADRCDLSPATRERVRKAAQKLGYLPSSSHARRRVHLWRNIGLLCGRYATLSGGIYSHLIEQLCGRLFDRGWHLLLTQVASPEDWRTMQLAQRLDGVLAVSHAPESVLASLSESRYPTVLLNMRSTAPLPQFIPDEKPALCALMDHLVTRGHRHILYLNSGLHQPEHFSEIERWATLSRAAENHRVRLQEILREDGAAAVACVRAGATAVICYNSPSVSAVLRAFATAGIKVPEQVSMACCEDLSWFQDLTPPMTGIHIPLQDLALQAIDSLQARIEASDPGPAQVISLPTTLHLRASIGPATTGLLSTHKKKKTR